MKILPKSCVFHSELRIARRLNSRKVQSRGRILGRRRKKNWRTDDTTQHEQTHVFHFQTTRWRVMYLNRGWECSHLLVVWLCLSRQQQQQQQRHNPHPSTVHISGNIQFFLLAEGLQPCTIKKERQYGREKTSGESRVS